jgi:hypothetical protein
MTTVTAAAIEMSTALRQYSTLVGQVEREFDRTGTEDPCREEQVQAFWVRAVEAEARYMRVRYATEPHPW